MKTIPPFIMLSALLTCVWAEEPKPEIIECKEELVPLEVIRPIGRVMPADQAAEAQTEAIPEKYAEEKEVAIKLEDLKSVGERLMMKATLRIINPTDKPVMFTGYSESSPITKVEHWKDGKWVEEKKVLRCGTGLRQCSIAPGQSAVFEAAVYAETMPTRIGIAYGQVAVLEGSAPRQITVWSEKIAR